MKLLIILPILVSLCYGFNQYSNNFEDIVPSAIIYDCANASDGAKLPFAGDCTKFVLCDGIYNITLTCRSTEPHFNKCTASCVDDMAVCNLFTCESDTTTSTTTTTTESSTTTTTTSTVTTTPTTTTTTTKAAVTTTTTKFIPPTVPVATTTVAGPPVDPPVPKVCSGDSTLCLMADCDGALCDTDCICDAQDVCSLDPAPPVSC
ncbi:integumentary mucin C.1-like [Chironomus tepperi]|uniref:integumentary mucin C.1-like n=1 Tax=Chironomus tepperi TaxID=113505 RepID=UPI00391F5D2C